MSSKYSKQWRVEQVKVLEDLFYSLPKNLDKVKSLNSRYDTSEKNIYSYSPNMVRAKISSMQVRLASGKVNSKFVADYNEFIRQAKQIINNPQEYIQEQIDDRKSAFLGNLKDMGLDKEYNRAKYLLNMLTDDERAEFFSSDRYQAPINDWESESWRHFYDEYERTPQVAKLEDWIKHNTSHTNVHSIFDLYEKVETDKRYK